MRKSTESRSSAHALRQSSRAVQRCAASAGAAVLELAAVLLASVLVLL
jgi:hypothetical protein